MCDLRLLGAARIVVGGEILAGPAAQRRRLALLALLASRPDGVSRDRLIGLLWAETTEARARHLLSESLYVLRRALGEDAIVARGDVLSLDRNRVACDLWAFESAVAAQDHSAAVALYDGDFLDGVVLDDAPDFARWVEGERDRLHREYVRMLVGHAAALREAGDLAGALSAWRRIAADDPYSGRVALELMRSLEAAGDRAGAIRHARIHAVLLREELGAEPDPEVEAYAERLRGAPAGAGPGTPSPAGAEIPPAPHPPPPGVPAPPPPPPPAPEPVAEAPEPEAAAGAPEPEPATGPPRPGDPPAGSRWRGPVRGRRVLAAGATGVLLAGLAIALVARGVSRPAEAASVAVLPFAGEAAGASPPEHVRDGIAEELIYALSQVPSLRVISSSSSFRFRDRDEHDAREIGERLRVRSLVTGTLARRGGAFRITVELLDVSTGAIRWSTQFERDTTALATFPDEIARTIAAALQVRLVPESRSTASDRWPADPVARDLYWQGRSHWNRRTEEGLRSAAQAFAGAIARDSAFALAYAGLADVHVQVVWARRDPRAGYDEAEALARRALALDPRIAAARATLGLVRMYRDWDWAGAEEEFIRALQLNPSYSPGHHWYGSLLAVQGRLDEALEMLRRAKELSPYSAAERAGYGTHLYYAGRNDEAREQFRQVLEIEPTFWPAWAFLASTALARGEHTRALTEAREAVVRSGGNPAAAAVLGTAYARAGRLDEARRTLAELRRERESGRPVSPVLDAPIHLALDEPARALELLEASAAGPRDPMLLVALMDPLFDGLRDHPRFEALVHRIRSPAAH
jgi:DNA-binding SARP family transcriptional activator/TolB-like protein/Tfp pilus assembly protein PilF